MIGTQLVSPVKQKEWSWQAAANFILGGAGTGFYLLGVFNIIFERGKSAVTHPVSLGMLAPALMGLGFVLLITEAGRPSRGRYLLYHLQNAWISRETLAFVFFVPAVILDQLFPLPFFKAWAALSALVFMVSQGFIVYASRAIPAWNVFIIPLFFISSGLASGAGIMLILNSSGSRFAGDGPVLISLICTITNLVIWVLYLRWSRNVDFQSATKGLRRPLMKILTIVIGHIFPMLILLLFYIQPYFGAEKTLSGTLAMSSGLALVVGVIAQKTGIVLSAGYTRGVDLKF